MIWWLKYNKNIINRSSIKVWILKDIALVISICYLQNERKASANPRPKENPLATPFVTYLIRFRDIFKFKSTNVFYIALIINQVSTNFEWMLDRDVSKKWVDIQTPYKEAITLFIKLFRKTNDISCRELVELYWAKIRYKEFCDFTSKDPNRWKY